MNRPHRRVTLAALAALCLTAGACSDDRVSGTPPGTPFVGTVPAAAPNGGTLPPPVGIASGEGVRLALRKVAEVREPVALSTRPGTTTLYLAEKTGRVKRMVVDRQVTADGVVERAAFRVDPEPVLDVTASIDAQGERGLLGLAFSADGGELYAYSTDRSGTLTLDGYRMDGERADTGTRRPLLRVPHPRSNHNGGQLTLGPDGFLYLGLGDGGGGGDPDRNAQNTEALLGKILRIDPTRPGPGDRAYAIPAGNPFAAAGGAPEVWAYGLRNPWRFSFDRRTGDLWIGDVGQNAWEEIDFLPAGGPGAGHGANLGWPALEGSHPFQGGTAPAGAVPPIHDYARDDGACSVIGGYVYRGATHPDWQGAYVWADYCEGEIHTLVRRPDGRIEDRNTGVTVPQGNLQSGGSITSFGEDGDGELYVLSAAGGVYRVEAA